MASNRGVVYVAPGKVEVRSIDFPKLVDPRGKRCDHGVILKVVSTNICGSDQHTVRSFAPALAAGTTAVIKLPGLTAQTNRLFKQSGVGRMNGVSALDDFLEYKHIAFNSGTFGKTPQVEGV
jgi:glutathione-independent formaldehyde dehydrogenase